MLYLKKCFLLAGLCLLFTLGTALPLKAATVYSGAWSPTSHSTEFFNVTFTDLATDPNFSLLLKNSASETLSVFNHSQFLNSAQVGFSKTNGIYTASTGGSSLTLGERPHFWLGYSLGAGMAYDYAYSLLTGTDQFQLSLDNKTIIVSDASPVPLPASIWLLGAALAGLVGFGRRYLN